MIDEQQLTERLASEMNLEMFQVLVANEPTTDLDEERIFCRWNVEAGAEEFAESNRTYHQLGTATLQIVAPKGSFSENALAIRASFFGIFRDWRSADGKLRVYRLSSTIPPSPDSYQVVCRIWWESYRKK